MDKHYSAGKGLQIFLKGAGKIPSLPASDSNPAFNIPDVEDIFDRTALFAPETAQEAAERHEREFARLRFANGSVVHLIQDGETFSSDPNSVMYAEMWASERLAQRPKRRRIGRNAT